MRSRIVFVCAMVACATAAHAGELPRSIGLYPTSGPSLALVDSKIDVAVRGPIVEAVVTQKFQNRTDHATEATYVFPLPVDAAVSAMSIKHGNRVIHAAIEKREEAQRRYEAAVRAGTHGALLDQERPDVFTQTVAAIPARGTIEISLRFDTIAQYRDGTWELALPLVVAPRYVPGVATNRPTTGTGRAPDTNRAPDASRITPPGGPGAGGATEVALHFTDKPTDLASPTHELKVAGTNATFIDPRTDHDAIIRWRAPAPAAGWVESSADGGYAAVVVEGPAAPAKRATLRCTLVLDRSAASRGDADALARPFVRTLLGALGTADRVAVAGSDQLAWAPPADIARSLEQSWAVPAGAFDLTRTLGSLRAEGAPIVLVSSGLVADDRAAITAAAKLGVPIHVIGVGPAPARGVLVQIAAASGGTVRFAVPGDDLGALAKAALADAASPPAPLTVTWGTLAASDVVPGTLPRLGAGQAMLVLARVKRAQTANGRARGELFAIETVPAPRTVEGATTTMGPLARRWARNRLDELLAARTNASVVTAHALRYGLVSPYTSMVAIGDAVVVEGGVKRSVAVPVSVPAGMKWQQVKKETTVDQTSTGPNVDARLGDKDVKDNVAKVDPKPTPPKPDGNGPVAQRAPTTKPKVEAKTERPEKKEPPRDSRVPRPEPCRPEPRPIDPRGGTYAPPPPPAPTTGSTTLGAGDGEGAAKNGRKRGRVLEEDSNREHLDGADDEASEPSPKSVATAESPASYDRGGGEVLVVEGTSGYGKRWRIGSSIGVGGLRLAGETTSLLALGARFEYAIGRRLLVGPDASLWFVDGNVAGNTHLAFTIGLVRHLELGLGFGLHLAESITAPAATTSLRYHATRRVAGFLRFDGALIDDKTQDKRRGQSVFSLGLELDF